MFQGAAVLVMLESAAVNVKSPPFGPKADVYSGIFCFLQRLGLVANCQRPSVWPNVHSPAIL